MSKFSCGKTRNIRIVDEESPCSTKCHPPSASCHGSELTPLLGASQSKRKAQVNNSKASNNVDLELPQHLFEDSNAPTPNRHRHMIKVFVAATILLLCASFGMLNILRSSPQQLTIVAIGTGENSLPNSFNPSSPIESSTPNPTPEPTDFSTGSLSEYPTPGPTDSSTNISPVVGIVKHMQESQRNSPINANENAARIEALKESLGSSLEQLPNASVASDHPICSKLGVGILQKGGNAVDAAVATVLCLGVANPASSGMGGGAFLLIRSSRSHFEQKQQLREQSHIDLPLFDDNRDQSETTDENFVTEVIDSREVAPEQSSRDMYKGLPFLASLIGGLAIPVPGELRGLELAHARHGRLPWSEVVEPAMLLARDGVPVHRHVAHYISYIYTIWIQKLGVHNPALSGIIKCFLIPKRSSSNSSSSSSGSGSSDSGDNKKNSLKYLQEGDIFKNPPLAKTLQAISEHGADAFYKGPLAESLVKDVRAVGGILTLQDLESYRPILRTPVSANVLGYTLVGAPPPSSGGAVVIAIARFLAGYKAVFPDASQAEEGLSYHRMVEGMRHAFAIRMSLSDPAFSESTNREAIRDMISGGYMESLRNITRDDNVLPLSKYGGPKWAQLKDEDGETEAEDAHEGDRRRKLFEEQVASESESDSSSDSSSASSSSSSDGCSSSVSGSEGSSSSNSDSSSGSDGSSSHRSSGSDGSSSSSDSSSVSGSDGSSSSSSSSSSTISVISSDSSIDSSSGGGSSSDGSRGSNTASGNSSDRSVDSSSSSDGRSTNNGNSNSDINSDGDNQTGNNSENNDVNSGDSNIDRIVDYISTSDTSFGNFGDIIDSSTSSLLEQQFPLASHFGYLEDNGTTHLSVVDSEGNSVAFTSSINGVFGSLVYSESTGVILGNTMNDFGIPIEKKDNYFGLKPSKANFIVPGKRPLSSMSPTIILRNGNGDEDGTNNKWGDLAMILGGSGGPKIITAVLLAIINTLFRRMNLFDAVMSPRVHDQLLYHDSVTTTVEKAKLEPSVSVPDEDADAIRQEPILEVSNAIKDALLQRHHKLLKIDYTGCVQAILVDRETNTLSAVSDMRKDGSPAGY